MDKGVTVYHTVTHYSFQNEILSSSVQKLLGWGVGMKGKGNDWDKGVWCEIKKKKILKNELLHARWFSVARNRLR